MVNYFPRYLITRAKHAVKIESIIYQENDMPICLILSCAEEEIYMSQKKHCLSFYIFFYILHKYFSEKIIH